MGRDRLVWWSSRQPSNEFDGRKAKGTGWCIQVLTYSLVLRGQTMLLPES